MIYKHTMTQTIAHIIVLKKMAYLMRYFMIIATQAITFVGVFSVGNIKGLYVFYSFRFAFRL